MPTPAGAPRNANIVFRVIATVALAVILANPIDRELSDFISAHLQSNGRILFSSQTLLVWLVTVACLLLLFVVLQLSFDV